MKTFVIGGAVVRREHPDHQKQALVLRNAMERIGRALIKAGHDLVVCSPFPDSADFEAVRGAAAVLSERAGPNIEFYTPNLAEARVQLENLLATLPRDRVKTFYQPISADEHGKPHLTYTWLLSQLPALERCKVLLALGGKLDGPASLILPIAESRRRDILPLSFLGGAAHKCFERRQYELMDRFGDEVAALQDPARVEQAVDLIGELEASPTIKSSSSSATRVFLSYPKARPLEADFIEMLLRRRDCDVYRDEEAFGAGESITAEIRDHLHRATVFVAVWCKEYACSPWCFDELELAISRHKEGKLELWILEAGQAKAINDCEQKAIWERRSHYDVRQNAPDAVGLALSGGGIRSATFSLGVLVALAQRGLLPQIDYLSTVSGGGYVGSFLSAFLNSPRDGEIGLRSTQLPFRRESGEAEALRHIRHHCKYLSAGSTWDQVAMISAQLYGMVLNGLAVVIFVALVVAFERLLRQFLPSGTLKVLTAAVLLVGVVCALFSLLTQRFWKAWQKYGDRGLAFSLVLFLGMLCIYALEPAHSWYKHLLSFRMTVWGTTKWLGAIGSIPLITSALGTLFGRLRKHLTAVLIVLTGIAVPVFLFGLYLVLYEIATQPALTLPYVGQVRPDFILWAAAITGLLGYWILFDVNSTSPHRHYRDKLADAFLIQRRKDQNGARKDAENQDSAFDASVSIRLSQLTVLKRCPYHLINCALNVPGSKNIGLQGRLTDFFLFSPCFSGSSLTKYYRTSEWEAADAHLDLGTAMAISAAAAAPQMGLATMRTLSFWLALLNIRLGYWAKKPESKRSTLAGAPGLFCLWKEMMGTMNESSPWLNLTDGGHIENLGVYELLRRRCKYIIAIDGEEDSNMTFHALTTLQRLAAIDLGVRIDINLDDLRLNDRRLSRSHFRFCRIRYPKEGRGSEDEFGYLLYLKLSLTGNEGEFIRRYRLDNPAFPHDSTADQFFTEAQFEAYRSLGEHVGEKLFLRAIVGDLANARSVKLEDWFLELGKGLLDPLPKAN